MRFSDPGFRRRDGGKSWRASRSLKVEERAAHSIRGELYLEREAGLLEQSRDLIYQVLPSVIG